MISLFKNLRFNNSRKFSGENFSELITRAKVTIKKNSVMKFNGRKISIIRKIISSERFISTKYKLRKNI